MEIIHQHPLPINQKARCDLLEKLHRRCIAELREQYRIPPHTTEIRGR
ncbi:MAG: hypothetical protein KHZ05_03225 [Oscillospiraceae bacterium]|nr:hypothetical protein [Oscillospiraceae bacterium]